MTVLASCHLPDGTWTFDVRPESTSPVIEVGFTADTLPVVFDRLTFGVTVEVDGTAVLDRTYPPAGSRYVSTDQQYMTFDPAKLTADDEATVTVWAENGGVRHEASTTFTVPRPPSPFPSWTWVDGRWMPPVPYPDGGGLYMWDENGQIWATPDPISEQGDPSGWPQLAPPS